MADRAHFGVTERVRCLPQIGDHHHRAPGYVQGQVGEVVSVYPARPLPDAVVASGGRDMPAVPFYGVRFLARDLFGEGQHSVTVDLWETYLEKSG